MTVQTAEQDSGKLDSAAVELQRWENLHPSSTLEQFARDGKAAYAIAQSIAQTPFVPASYKSSGPRSNKTWFTPEVVAANVTAAFLAGDEIGLRPMQALAAIDIIEGRPALNALAMRALVLSHGHDVWVEEQPVPNASTQQLSVTVAGQRKGSERVQRITWTWQRARQANLVEKTNWQNHPIEMLIARATSAVCRLIAADVLMGLAYSSEELADEFGVGESAPAETKTVKRSASAVRGVQERPLLGNALNTFAGPQPGDEPGDDAPEPEQPPGPTKSDEEEATEERSEPTPGEALAVAAAQQEDPEACAELHADGRRCKREPGHEGKHYFGRKGDEPEPTQEPTPALSEFTPTAEELAAQNEEDEPLYPEPTQEEQDRAYEEERQARAERDAAAAAVPPVVPTPAPAGVPAHETAAPVAPEANASQNGEDADDPWADFR